LIDAMMTQKHTQVPFTVTAQAAAGVLLIVLGGVTWRAAGVADAAAHVHEQMATLQSSAAATGVSIPGWLMSLTTLVDSDVRTHETVAAYWTGDYRSLADRDRSETSEQADALLLSANAALRRAQREAAGRPLTSERLDQVLQAYAAVLKNSGFDRDAAYNYEYVARLRDAAARAKPPRPEPPSRTPVRNLRPGDLPLGPTIHGRPGTHPPATKGEEFEVLTPMNFGDREAQPEPTPGVRLPKKG
jgi:hypothetical protein